MKNISLLLTIIMTLAMGFTACDNTGSNGGTGTMEVTMTDAPTNYDSVNVTINKVRVNKKENAETDSTESDEEAEENGWVTIMNQQMKINLLELTNGNQIMLGSKELEAGTYSQIRFILGDDNTVTVDGQTHPLQTPSAKQSGLKLNVDAEVENGVTYSLLIDFDVARSIVEKGNDGYLLKPVLRAVNLAETGSIAGNVQPADFNTNVLAVLEGDTVTSTITAENGTFEIIGLAPDSDYEVVFDPSSDQYSDSTQTNIKVEAGKETDLDTIQLEQNSTL
ncbi:Carboxypeptidase regulatory-like domain-containing protein [Fodinibius salinus]|uniref:Carboxypeptidase regulatory-like domain-containing protein n=1 Tax=Fodinibius salinus TaxID=860790 RepID=A0A5D3YEY9_9BACT|nr:DUF4382 domain-containing protein [Fodinibius salinus]TYP91976.1 Carboxypeptidase regulatory-like domain-containing protein [Fodinibius salinus]